MTVLRTRRQIPKNCKANLKSYSLARMLSETSVKPSNPMLSTRMPTQMRKLMHLLKQLKQQKKRNLLKA